MVLDVQFSSQEKRFRIAVSYAREYQNNVYSVMNELLKYGFSKSQLLYDKFLEYEFSRPNLDFHLYELFSKQSELIVVFLSEEYNKKSWTGLEWRAIRRLMNDRENDHSIMFVRFDKSIINGLYFNVDGAIDASQHSSNSLAELIFKRYQQNQGHITDNEAGTPNKEANLFGHAIEKNNKLIQTDKPGGDETNDNIVIIRIIATFSIVVIIIVGLIMYTAMKLSENVAKLSDNVAPKDTESVIDRPFRTTYNAPSEIEVDFDRYIVLKLANANHQYANGLNYWKRLDYNKAYSEISTAKDEIIQQKSQSELEVAKINNSLGALCLDMGRYPEADKHLMNAYTTFDYLLGSNSLEARATKASIAQYDYNTGNFEKALKETQEIIDQSDPETEKVIIACTSHFRAMIFDSQGKYEVALTIYQSVFDLYKNFINDDNLSEDMVNYTNNPQLDKYTNALQWIILTYNNIGEVYIHMSDYENAESYLNTALSMSLENVYIGQRNLHTARILNNLAVVTMNLNQTKYAVDAIDDIDTSIRIQRNLFDFKDDFPGLVEAYSIFGDVYLSRGETSQALEKYKSAEVLSISFFGENHPQTASVYNRLGLFYYDQGDTVTANDYFIRAIESRKNFLGNYHPDTVRFYLNLALSQKDAGLLREAKASVESAEFICDKLGITGIMRIEIDSLLSRLDTVE